MVRDSREKRKRVRVAGFEGGRRRHEELEKANILPRSSRKNSPADSLILAQGDPCQTSDL